MSINKLMVRYLETCLFDNVQLQEGWATVSRGGNEMVEKIPDLPDNVLGYTARGTATSDNYESVIIPALEELSS